MEENVDDNFHTDFLLTYRSFMNSIEPIVTVMKERWTKGLPEQRERVSGRVLRAWLTVFVDHNDCIELGFRALFRF